MAKRILHDGEHVLVLAGLDEERVRRRQTRLLEPRAIEVEPGDRPERRGGLSGKACDQPREEKGRGRVVGKRGFVRGYLVERRCRHAVVTETIVYLR